MIIAVTKRLARRRIHGFATDLMANAAAVFHLYADNGVLEWDAFPTAVRGCGFDPTEKQLAEMWAKINAASDEESGSERITFQQFSSALHIAPGLADVDSALAALGGPRRLTAADAKTLMTTVGVRTRMNNIE